MVQFGQGEPITVHRGGKWGPLLYARVDDVASLPAEDLAELTTWLGDLGLEVPSVLVLAHGSKGQVSVAGKQVSVASLPSFLRP